ncbi:MAG TPA: DUF3810 family protein, partial [bacterium]|nr:DUF3810 family protein [bacterium]
MATGIAAWGLSRIFAKFPEATEAMYGRAGPAIARALSLVTGAAPFSVAEGLVFVYVAVRVCQIVRGMVRAARRRQSWGHAIGRTLLIAGRDTGIILTGFYVLWGWNYARPPVEERWHLPPAAPETDAAFVASLSQDFLERANASYRAIHGSDDAGAPTQLPEHWTEVDAFVEEGWRELAQSPRLDSHFDPHLEARRGRGKRLLAGELLSHLGLSGFYFPFTGEANVNGGVPAVAMPQVLSHEKAHQRGFGPEDEANFLGFLAAASSRDPHAQYSAFVFAHRQLLRVLLSLDRTRGEEVMKL